MDDEGSDEEDTAAAKNPGALFPGGLLGGAALAAAEEMERAQEPMKSLLDSVEELSSLGKAAGAVDGMPISLGATLQAVEEMGRAQERILSLTTPADWIPSNISEALAPHDVAVDLDGVVPVQYATDETLTALVEVTRRQVQISEQQAEHIIKLYEHHQDQQRKDSWRWWITTGLIVATLVATVITAL